jgi:hypothetical protein
MTTMNNASGRRSMVKPSCHISMVMSSGSEKKIAPPKARARPLQNSSLTPRRFVIVAPGWTERLLASREWLQGR